MKAKYIYRLKGEEHFQVVDVIGQRLDRESLRNYWTSFVSHHVPEGAEFVDAYYCPDIEVGDIPLVYGYYTFRFIESVLKPLNTKYMVIESPVLMLPEPLPVEMVKELAQELVEKKDSDNGWRLVDYSWNSSPATRKPKPVWVKVNDRGPEFLRWAQGVLYDRGIAYTPMGVLTHPESKEDTRDFLDSPFNGYEIRSV